jgi:hypothetical protein
MVDIDLRQSDVFLAYNKIYQFLLAVLSGIKSLSI